MEEERVYWTAWVGWIDFLSISIKRHWLVHLLKTSEDLEYVNIFRDPSFRDVSVIVGIIYSSSAMGRLTLNMYRATWAFFGP